MSDTVWLIIVAAGIVILLILKKIACVKHTFRSVLFSMLLGILALTVVNLCSSFTSVSLPVSRLSLAVSAFLGLPGVISMLILQLML